LAHGKWHLKQNVKNGVLRFDEHITVCANVHAQATAVLLFEKRKFITEDHDYQEDQYIYLTDTI